MTTTATYTWPAVLAMVSAPTEEEAERYANEIPNAELMERGSQIRSEKILTDLVRFGGILGEFWPKATAAQKRHVLGFSEPLLKVFVHSGKKLADMVAQFDATEDDREVSRAAAHAVADRTYKEGMEDRERLVTALEGVAHLEPGLEERISKATGRVTDFTTLAQSLTALTKIAKDIRQNPLSKAARQLEDGGLDSAQILAFEDVAANVKSTGALASGARTKGKITQADLDLQDGICLALMERVMKIVNRAHERDPSIPKLTPITTRRMFPSRKRNVDAPAPEGSTGG
ncbi:hypothetical protein [Polyangium mundeleinium]|uniref:Uncharacterized protein n=1 Tax=Polyangium mundeleinium TaxID=2995306 RepID=A0ABT5EZ00_9BACT|nr:hypothetical protein [Polyangium mundeleinium]MDC0746388.1 hypothetical protein [Polyangium mundeleinium]